MGDRIIKLLGEEVIQVITTVDPDNTDTVRTNLGGATLVRVMNVYLKQLLITQKTSGGGAVGTISIEAKKELFIAKDPTDTVEFSGPDGGTDDILFVSVAFT